MDFIDMLTDAEGHFQSPNDPLIKGTIRSLCLFPSLYAYSIVLCVTYCAEWLPSCLPSMLIYGPVTLKFLHWNGESMVIMY